MSFTVNVSYPQLHLIVFFLQIPEQCEEVVANKAIELWQYYAQPQNDQLKK